MSHFLLFIPGESEQAGKNHLRLEQVGLGEFVDGAEFLDTQESPAGSPGLLVAWRKPGDERFHFNADQQTWLKAVPAGGRPAGRYWLGVWNDAPPTPVDLIRHEPIWGHYVTLGDGREWMLPAKTEITADRVLNDEGEWIWEIQPRYRDFDNRIAHFQKFIVDADDKSTISYGELSDFILEALQWNYRLLPEIASHLRLLNTDNLNRCLFAILNMTPDVLAKVREEEQQESEEAQNQQDQPEEICPSPI